MRLSPVLTTSFVVAPVKFRLCLPTAICDLIDSVPKYGAGLLLTQDQVSLSVDLTAPAGSASLTQMVGAAAVGGTAVVGTGETIGVAEGVRVMVGVRVIVGVRVGGTTAAGFLPMRSQLARPPYMVSFKPLICVPSSPTSEAGICKRTHCPAAGSAPRLRRLFVPAVPRVMLLAPQYAR